MLIIGANNQKYIDSYTSYSTVTTVGSNRGMTTAMVRFAPLCVARKRSRFVDKKDIRPRSDEKESSDGAVNLNRSRWGRNGRRSECADSFGRFRIVWDV